MIRNDDNDIMSDELEELARRVHLGIRKVFKKHLSDPDPDGLDWLREENVKFLRKRFNPPHGGK